MKRWDLVGDGQIGLLTCSVNPKGRNLATVVTIFLFFFLSDVFRGVGCLPVRSLTFSSESLVSAPFPDKDTFQTC